MAKRILKKNDREKKNQKLFEQGLDAEKDQYQILDELIKCGYVKEEQVEAKDKTQLALFRAKQYGTKIRPISVELPNSSYFPTIHFPFHSDRFA